MQRCAAFLRAINVGGHRITSVELCERFEGLGFREATTFRASGNVIFTAREEPPAEMAVRIEEGLTAALGYEVPVFVRTASDVRAIARHQPFPKPVITASRGKLQVALLSAPPSALAREQVLDLATNEDKLAFGARELHWLPSGGITDSSLDLNAIARLLGPMTVRTKGTVEQVAAKYFTQGPGPCV